MDHIDIYFAGDHSRQLYSQYVPTIVAAFNRMAPKGNNWEWDRTRNELRVLVATPKDFDSTEAYTKYDLTALQTCEIVPSAARAKVEAYLNVQRDKLYKYVLSGAGGFSSGGASHFNESILSSPFNSAETFSEMTFAVFSQSPATMNLSTNMKIAGGVQYAVVSMPDDPTDLNVWVSGFAGIDSEYFKLGLDSRNFVLQAMAHEILGHAAAGHGGASDACGRIKYEELDTKLFDEGLAEAASSEAVRAGKEDKIVRNPDKVLAEAEALRAFGNLYQTENIFSIKYPAQVFIHATTLSSDVKNRGRLTALHRQSGVSGVSALPPIITTVADIVSGWVYALKMEERVKSSPRWVTQKDKDFFHDVEELKYIVEQIASLGQDIRFGRPAMDGLSEIKKDPSYFVMAMEYLRKTGEFDRVKSHLKKELHPAFDDFLNDYSASIEKIGTSSLKGDQMQFEKVLAGRNFDLKKIVGLMIQEIVLAPGGRGGDIYTSIDVPVIQDSIKAKPLGFGPAIRFP